MDISDCVRLHENARFNRIYLISGLRRSGNHLLLQILNCSFSDNSILFINDFPSLKNKDINYTEQQFHQFRESGYIKRSLIDINYNHSSFKCGDGKTNANKLIIKDDIDNLYDRSSKWTDKILILSFEDQPISIMNQFGSILQARCNKLYKIIIIRDILNCFASRFAAICDRENKYKYNISPDKMAVDLDFSELVKKGGFFKTDALTYDIWKEHSIYSKSSEYITFNYNKFMCLPDKYKIDIFYKLDIEYNELFFKEKSSYGHGSSYNPSNDMKDTKPKNDEYFWRFINNICSQVTDKKPIGKYDINFIIILNRILNDKEILEILREDFIIDITKEPTLSTYDKYTRFKQEPTYIITNCFEQKRIKFNEILYYIKYLKYKTKYLHS